MEEEAGEVRPWHYAFGFLVVTGILPAILEWAIEAIL